MYMTQRMVCIQIGNILSIFKCVALFQPFNIEKYNPKNRLLISN